MEMPNLSRPEKKRTRSICPENRTGEKGRGGMMASVAYRYQQLPAAPLPPLPGRDSLEVI